MRKESAMKLGVFTVSIPQWEPLEALEELSALGYEGVEWRIVADAGDRSKPSFWSGNRAGMTALELLAAAEQLKTAARRYGMAMPSLGTYMDCDDLPAVETAMRAAAALGAGSLRVGPGRFNVQGEPYPVQLERARGQYAQVANLAAQYGVRALIETHPNQIRPQHPGRRGRAAGAGPAPRRNHLGPRKPGARRSREDRHGPPDRRQLLGRGARQEHAL
jgi:sugar phosphate isomerase/epimerase